MEYRFECSILVASLMLFILTTRATASLSPKGINYEVVALMAIKGQLIDPDNVLEAWDINSVDPCSWSMVICSPDGSVTAMGIPSQRLSGTLSRGIGNLTNLQTLLLQNNEISGPIPVELGKLENLQTLDLSGNQFSGWIPSSLGQLKNLKYLRLNNNKISGPFPGSLANISGMTLLDLSYNNLSGPIPRILAKSYNMAGNPFLCEKVKNCPVDSPTPISVTLDTDKNTVPSRWHKGQRVAIALKIPIIMTFG